jgi:hypothetical protein
MGPLQQSARVRRTGQELRGTGFLLRHPDGVLPGDRRGLLRRRLRRSGTVQLGLQRREQLQQLLGQLTGDIAQLRERPALPQADGPDEAHQLPGVEGAVEIAAKGVGEQEPGVLLRHVRIQQLPVGGKEAVHV